MVYNGRVKHMKKVRLWALGNHPWNDITELVKPWQSCVGDVRRIRLQSGAYIRLEEF